MISVLLGLGAAGAWGVADFIARFTSRELGPARSLFGALIAGALLFSLALPFVDAPLVPTTADFGFSVAGGVLNTTGLLLLYAALARGPVAVVAPIIAGHPALAVALLVGRGVMPQTGEWTGMGLTMAGILLLTRSVAGRPHYADMDRDYVRRTIQISLAASALFGLQIVVMQEARASYGALTTTWLTRLVSVAALLLWGLHRGQRLTFPRAHWPLVGLQGILDAMGAFFMLAGSVGTDRAVVTVISSTFAAITVLLARIVLKEPVTRVQWLAIMVVLAGIGLLSVAG